MRVLLTVEMDTAKANAAITDKTLAETISSVLGPLKPEAAYFGSKNGSRTGFIVFDLQEASDIPSIAEPFFQKLGAKISFVPVMNLDDVQEGLRKYAGG
jgi:hypothetical protein